MPTLSEKVDFLRQTTAYRPPAKKVEVIETHLSFVFLAGAEVFKLKKPVRNDALDFSGLMYQTHQGRPHSGAYSQHGT